MDDRTKKSEQYDVKYRKAWAEKRTAGFIRFFYATFFFCLMLLCIRTVIGCLITGDKVAGNEFMIHVIASGGIAVLLWIGNELKYKFSK